MKAEGVPVVFRVCFQIIEGKAAHNLDAKSASRADCPSVSTSSIVVPAL